MGRRTDKDPKSHTLPSSPTHSFSSSSSSSDFEFTISLSPRKSSTNLCPADELFYKGQLLPLHPSPRISMVRTLLLASSSTTSSSSDTTASRDSSGSSTDSQYSSFTTTDLVLGLLPDCDSSRPSSVTEDDEFKRLNHHQQQMKRTKYFSFSRFSSVFRKEPKTHNPDNISGSSVKRMSATAKEVIRKYLKKVKPLYEKLSQKQQQKMETTTTMMKTEGSVENARKDNNGGLTHSFSGNLRQYPTRRRRRRSRCVSSCPSSMRSSPTHSGILCRNGFPSDTTSRSVVGMSYTNSSSMEELQSAIQGAIAHCKNSMIQNKTMLSNEI
uniref:Putative membrane-associated kinase regulator 1 n=1 Tax=Davidia involucrata TaxID=16924 RepID=A0A5B6Z3I0_DAVIN